MLKNLNIYPIPTGEELNVFSSDDIQELKILDMHGNLMYTCNGLQGSHNRIDIRHLPGDTYIVEVVFINTKTGRSVFVKL